MAAPTYIKSLRGKRSRYGVRISGKINDVIAELKALANEKGYINLELKERREEDRYGNTHYLVLDTYQTRDEPEPPPPPPSQQAFTAPTEEIDDLPF